MNDNATWIAHEIRIHNRRPSPLLKSVFKLSELILIYFILQKDILLRHQGHLAHMFLCPHLHLKIAEVLTPIQGCHGVLQVSNLIVILLHQLLISY